LKIAKQERGDGFIDMGGVKLFVDTYGAAVFKGGTLDCSDKGEGGLYLRKPKREWW
jgi:hypothetical protein